MMLQDLFVLLGITCCSLAALVPAISITNTSPHLPNASGPTPAKDAYSVDIVDTANNLQCPANLPRLDCKQQGLGNSSLGRRDREYVDFEKNKYQPFAPLWQKSYITWSVHKFLISMRVPGRDWQLLMIQQAFDDFARYIPLEFEQVPHGWESDISFSVYTSKSDRITRQGVSYAAWYDLDGSRITSKSIHQGPHQVWVWFNTRYHYRRGRGHWDFQNTLLFHIGQILGLATDYGYDWWSIMNREMCLMQRRDFQPQDIEALQEWYGVRPPGWVYRGPREGPGKDNILW